MKIEFGYDKEGRRFFIKNKKTFMGVRIEAFSENPNEIAESINQFIQERIGSETNLYLYKVKRFIKNYDGDTIDLEIDLGFNTIRIERVRLYGVDTYEMRAKDKKEKELAREAQRYVELKLNTAKALFVETIKDKTGKYGRMLAIIWYDGINLNDELVEKGYAKEYWGGKR